MSDTKNCECKPETEKIFIPVNLGLGLCLDPNKLPKPDALTPGPDDTHLVTRDGELAWEPMPDIPDAILQAGDEGTHLVSRDGEPVWEEMQEIPQAILEPGSNGTHLVSRNDELLGKTYRPVEALSPALTPRIWLVGMIRFFGNPFP